MIWVAICGVIFAVLSWLSSAAVGAAVLFGLCVFAHVAGNAIGTQLRKNGDTPIPADERAKGKKQKLTAESFAPVSRLSNHHPMASTVLVTTAVGAICGGLFGGGVLFWLYWAELDFLGAFIGFAATCFIGGIAGFSIGGFVHALFGASHEAVKRSEGLHR